jgi:polypeptide N-acetylgalactosaminyltransferase
MLSKNGEIRRDEHCFDYSGGKGNLGLKDKIFTYNCHSQGGNQKWKMENDQIIHESGYCIEISPDKVSIIMQVCNPDNIYQKWKWKKRNELN